MIKAEIVDLLVEKYGYDVRDLKDDKGNIFNKPVLEEILEKEEAKEEEAQEKKVQEVEEKVEEAPEEENDIFALNEDAFKPSHVFDDNDLILCMSGVKGNMTFKSQLSGFTVKTTNFGQTVKIPYKDLVYVHNVSPRAFHEGHIIVLNEHLQEEFNLGNVYKSVITPNNIQKVLKLDSKDLSKFISDMPSGMKPALYDEARKMYRDGRLDSIRTVEAIEKEFGISLEDNAPISDEVGK